VINPFELSSTRIVKYLHINSVGISFNGLYIGLQCDASEVELMACLLRACNIAAHGEALVCDLDNKLWPHTFLPPPNISESRYHLYQKTFIALLSDLSR
jgi:hypothetical protein